jgi:hypothetical protein
MGPTDSLSENILKGVFSTGGLSDYLREVETLQRTVEDDARAADAQCILLIHLELQCRLPNWSYVGAALKFDEHSSKH